MVRFGAAELGVESLFGRLGLTPPARGAEPTESLLTCVYQGTRNSSEAHARGRRVSSPRGSARASSCSTSSPLCELYRELGAQALGRPLDWETDDLALQNVQARARGPSVWLVANLTGALLLTTSNRSEAAVGYATMDGDTCGGLAPIAGADKSFLARVAALDGARGQPRARARAGARRGQTRYRRRPSCGRRSARSATRTT